MIDLLDAGGFGLWAKELCRKAALLGGMVGFSLGGSLGLKRAADTGEAMFFAAGLAAWLISGGFFVELLRGAPLGLYGTAASIIQMGLTMALSATLLGESYQPMQWMLTGTAITFAGLSLMMGVQHG